MIADTWAAIAKQDWYSSTDQPTQLVIAALCFAKRPHRTLELGACEGGTTEYLAVASGEVVAVESDPGRLAGLSAVAQRQPNIRVVEQEVLAYLRNAAADGFDFVYVDDDHTEPHVAQVVAALPRVCKTGALICFHDIEAPSAYIGRLCEEAGGYVLHIGDWGLGIWQLRK